MVNFLLKIWTFFEILSFLKRRKEQKEQDECNSKDSLTQDLPKNISDTQ